MGFGLVALITAVLYYPAIGHHMRADHWMFMGHSTMFDTWWSQLRICYSYSRIADLTLGDIELFRPLMHAMQVSERWLFGYNFAWWQLAGIVLHLAAVYWLMRVLACVRPGSMATITGLVFATSRIVQPAVIWHHINGYIAYTLFMLVALYHLYRHAEEGQHHRWRLVAIAAALFAACCTFEAGVALGIPCILYLWYASHGDDRTPLSRWWSLVLLVPALVYGVWDYCDFRYVHPVVHPSILPGVLESFSMVRTLYGTLYVMLVYVYAFLFPLSQALEQTESLYLLPLSWNFPRSAPFAGSAMSIAIAVLTAVFLVYILVLAMRRTRRMLLPGMSRDGRRLVGFALLCCCMACASAALIVVGRSRDGGLLKPLERNVYYSYLILPFLITGVYAFAHALRNAPAAKRMGIRWRLFGGILLCAVASLGAWQVYRANCEILVRFPSGNQLFARTDASAMQTRLRWEYFMQRGLALYYANQFTASVAFLTQAVDTVPTNSVAHLCRGSAYNQLEQWTNALADYELAWRYAPGDEDASNRVVSLRQWLVASDTNLPAGATQP